MDVINRTGEWWIQGDELEHHRFRGELSFDKRGTGVLTFAQGGDPWPRDILEFLSDADDFVVIGRSATDSVICTNCSSRLERVATIVQSDSGISYGDEFLVFEELEIIVNTVFVGTAQNPNDLLAIQEIDFENDLLTSWFDVLRPEIIETGAQNDYETYRFKRIAETSDFVIEDSGTVIRFANWWHRYFERFPRRRAHFETRSTVRISKETPSSYRDIESTYWALMRLVSFCMEEPYGRTEAELYTEKGKPSVAKLHRLDKDAVTRSEFWRCKPITFAGIPNWQPTIDSWLASYQRIKAGVVQYQSTLFRKDSIDQVMVKFVIAFERLHKAFYTKPAVAQNESELEKRLLTFTMSDGIQHQVVATALTRAGFGGQEEMFAKMAKDKRNQYAHGDSAFFWDDRYDFYLNAFALKSLSRLMILKHIFQLDETALRKFMAT